MKMFILAACALFAIVASWAHIRAVLINLQPRTYRQRTDGGIRLRDTKNGLGVILPGGRFVWMRETIAGILVRVMPFIGSIARVLRAAIDGLRKTRYVNVPAIRLRNIGPILADHKQVLETLREQQASVSQEMEVIQAGADEGKRALNEDETKRMEALYEAFNGVSAQIEQRERLLAVQARMSQPVQKTEKPGTGAEKPRAATQREPGTFDDDAVIRGGDRTEAFRGTGGYKAFGEFAKSVCMKAVGGQEDPRLKVFAAAPSSFGSEGVGADGGYLIPPDFRTSILKKVQAEDSLLGRTDQQTTTSNSITIPVDETTPWQSSGGIQAYWEGESQTYTQSKPALKSVSVRAHKLTALVPVTDEQLEDGPSLEAYLRNKAPDKINYKVNDALINGKGAGIPLGIMNSPAKITVPKKGGQATGTILFENIVAMWARAYDPCRRKGIWLINQDAEPQLFQMVVPGTQAAFPAYMPPGGLSQAPYGTLMGRPVVYTEACQQLSTEGDILFWDPSTYLTLMKASGLRSDMSIHLWFDQGLTAFRFTLRLGGIPWWAAAIARANSTNTLSCILSLQTR